MASVRDHYDKHLAPIYVWMAGGIEAALAQGAADVAPCVSPDAAGRIAVDLGAGFGMHAIELARHGYSVVAVDACAELLEELGRHAGALDVRRVNDDLLNFRDHVPGGADLIVCMGDTLTHLQHEADVERLFRDIAAALAPGGRFVMTYRDYSSLPEAEARFIPVRSDSDQILTCFLEEEPAHVVVHDLLHRRRDGGWELRVSSYRKLRLPTPWIMEVLGRAGLRAKAEPAARGMIKVTSGAA